MNKHQTSGLVIAGKIGLLLLIMLATVACESQPEPQSKKMNPQQDEKALMARENPEGLYGSEPASAPVNLEEIMASPEGFEGRTVAVKGTIDDVCGMRGCWIDIRQPITGQLIRYKVADGEIVFPKSAKGRQVVAEGVVEKLVYDAEAARKYRQHLAEEQGLPADSIHGDGPMTLWRIKGGSARIGTTL